MKIDDFQKECFRTLPDQPHIHMPIYGLAGEVGELIDYLKKIYFQGHELDRELIVSEVGDILFYLSVLARMYGIKMSEVIEYNVDKRLRRYPNGFDPEASKNREV